MTLPAEVQAHVNAIRAALGLPVCSKITIDMDDAGNVQHVKPEMTFRRLAYRSGADRRTIPVDKLTGTSAL